MVLSYFKCKEDLLFKSYYSPACLLFLRKERGHIGPCLRSTSLYSISFYYIMITNTKNLVYKNSNILPTIVPFFPFNSSLHPWVGSCFYQFPFTTTNDYISLLPILQPLNTLAPSPSLFPPFHSPPNMRPRKLRRRLFRSAEGRCVVFEHYVVLSLIHVS
jgi:hypothetical protein